MIYQNISATGRFVFPNGDLFPLDEDISVEIEQTHAAKTFLICQEGNKLAWKLSYEEGQHPFFRGQTLSGLPIVTSLITVHLGEGCFSIKHVKVGSTSQPYSAISAAVTNLTLDTPRDKEIIFPEQDVISRIALKAVDNVKVLSLEMKKSRYPKVTSTLDVFFTDSCKESRDESLRDLCSALSIVRGTKIQWIERTAYDSQNRFVWSEFGETITKNYEAGNLCLDFIKRTEVCPLLSDVPRVYSRVRWFRKEYDGDNRIINAWLDARLQDDFLEARTLKYVVVMEALCNAVQHKHPEIATKFVGKIVWKKAGKQLLPDIRNRLIPFVGELAAEKFDPSTWGEINREPFRDLLGRTLRRFGIEMDPVRLSGFKDVRNKIVHSLKYLEATDFKPNEVPIDHNAQHFLVVAMFVDEVILRLFGLAHRVNAPEAEPDLFPNR